MKAKGTVYLIGAGPGDAGLLTLRGAEILRKADVVVYDALVNPQLLRLAPTTAEVIFGGKRSRMAAVFQIADGAQIGAAGALRGYKDTKIPMVINMFAYWALGFPLAYMAAITYRAPPSYIWAGFVLGLSAAAILLTLRFLKISRQQLEGQLS